MKKLLICMLCGLLIAGCSSKKNDASGSTPTPTPDVTQEENKAMKLGELLPESVKELTLRIETSTEVIDIEFKEEVVDDVLSQLKELEVTEDYTAHTGSGSLSYCLTMVDDAGNETEITEQGNVLKLSDGTKVGALSTSGVIDEYAKAMDWVVSISSYERLTPLRIETDDYIIRCEKGKTSAYDLAYLKDVEFDPFELGFTVTVDGTDLVLAQMPEEGDYLLILTKENTNVSYQLKVTSSVK